MEQEEIKKLIEFSVTNKRKINFQMVDTPIDKFILFHPHTLCIDQFKDRLECFGYVEKHYASSDTNYSRMPVLTGITNVIVLDDTFDIQDNWLIELKKYGLEKEILAQVK